MSKNSGALRSEVVLKLGTDGVDGFILESVSVDLGRTMLPVSPQISLSAESRLSTGTVECCRRDIRTNPVRDVGMIRSKSQPRGAVVLTGHELRDLLTKLRASVSCHTRDLVDPITILIATGMRRSGRSHPQVAELLDRVMCP
jgi:hypothetical protein